jgi:hypothetical protein
MLCRAVPCCARCARCARCACVSSWAVVGGSCRVRSPLAFRPLRHARR